MNEHQHLKKAREKLRAAEVLFDSDLLEDAASRAYYAMFHAAKEYLLTKGEKPRTHRGVISLMYDWAKKDDNLSEDSMKSLMSGLQIRLVSDYDIKSTLGKDEVEELLDSSREFVDYICTVLEVNGND